MTQSIDNYEHPMERRTPLAESSIPEHWCKCITLCAVACVLFFRDLSAFCLGIAAYSHIDFHICPMQRNITLASQSRYVIKAIRMRKWENTMFLISSMISGCNRLNLLTWNIGNEEPSGKKIIKILRIMIIIKLSEFQSCKIYDTFFPKLTTIT